MIKKFYFLQNVNKFFSYKKNYFSIKKIFENNPLIQEDSESRDFKYEDEYYFLNRELERLQVGKMEYHQDYFCKEMRSNRI